MDLLIVARMVNSINLLIFWELPLITAEEKILRELKKLKMFKKN